MRGVNATGLPLTRRFAPPSPRRSGARGRRSMSGFRRHDGGVAERLDRRVKPADGGKKRECFGQTRLTLPPRLRGGWRVAPPVTRRVTPCPAPRLCSGRSLLKSLHWSDLPASPS